MPGITDLSDLAGVGAPKQVRLVTDGPVYSLPADVPAPLYLRLVEFDKLDLKNLSTEAEQEIIAELYEEVLELFRVYQPDLNTLPISLPALIRVVPAVYGKDAEQAEGRARPSSGTRSSSKRKTTRPRSSS